jgi:hypothetical protein
MSEEESIESMPATSKSLEHHRATMAHIAGRDPFSSPHRSVRESVSAVRIAELEVENLRLQRLVAELLIKNQQLRKHEDLPTT